MRRSLVLVGWLLVVWVALWGDISWANVLGGLVTAGGLVLLFPLRPATRQGYIRPWPALRFAVYFLWKLVEASAVVAWEVVTPHNRINEGIVAVPIHGLSNALVTIVANAISLTPGTLTLEVDEDPAVLYVHVLHLHDLEAVRLEVQHLERLAIAAFGPDDALRARAGAARDPARSRDVGGAVRPGTSPEEGQGPVEPTRRPR